MPEMARYVLFPIIIFSFIQVEAQTGNTVIRGRVNDTSGVNLHLVNIVVRDVPYGTYSLEDGSYIFSMPADNKDHLLVFSFIGYEDYEVIFRASPDTLLINAELSPAVSRLEDVIITGLMEREAPSLKNIPIKNIRLIPAAAGNLEKLLVSLPGVNSVSELSNQYSVRGGNYDENLVYVDDIEIYHPVLIKTGEQEGLSFLNPDLISSVRFSAGGFNASYGDRMSSVLDISYRDVKENKASVMGGLHINSFHLEGKTKNERFSYLAGVRYKTNQLLLQTLDTKGNYKPSFYDLQSLFRYRLSKKAELSLMGSFNSNTYTFIPASRRSTFGNINEAYQIFVLYNGSETDSYKAFNLALSLNLFPGENFSNRIIAHYYNSAEEEKYDIRASYALNLLDKNMGSENFGDSIMNVGVGSWLKHARNILRFNILTLNYKGRWENGSNVISYGFRYKHEMGTDRMREWEKTDSAGFSIPLSGNQLLLSNVLINDTSLATDKFEFYLIDNYTFNLANQEFILTGGARLSYWSFSKELLFSPRLSLSWKPPSNNTLFYIAGGVYYQPPFYREMRYPGGGINRDIRSQKSVHTVLGASYDFFIGNTPLKLTGEVYYKNLQNIIPYKYDNVRILYSAENIASGFVRGLDLRLNGEFVKDAESWISLTLMDARHDIENDGYGAFPAPSDSRFSVNVFFQDYFPTNPYYRAHINLHFSTGIPLSSPYSENYLSYMRMPPYRRVDIGFTRLVKSRHKGEKEGLTSFFDEIIAGFEIFNLLDIRNTISYNWLTTVNNLSGETRQYAVPNYLTGRSFNFKFIVSF